MKNNYTFDEAYNRLQTLYSELQNKELSMEELTQHVQESSELIKLCKDKLSSIESNLNEVFEDKE